METVQQKLNIEVSSTSLFCCLKRESQKLVPSRNFSRLEPQIFVPANHKKSPIRKIKLPQNFRATRYPECWERGCRTKIHYATKEDINKTRSFGFNLHFLQSPFAHMFATFSMCSPRKSIYSSHRRFFLFCTCPPGKSSLASSVASSLGLDKFCWQNFEQNKRFLERAFCRQNKAFSSKI